MMKRSGSTHKSDNKSSNHFEMNKVAVDKLYAASRKDVEAVYTMMESSEKGILEATAEERILKYGLNEVENDKAPSWFTQLMKSFVNPFNLILLTIVIISFGIDVWFAAHGEKDFKTVSVVSLMIVISALLSFFQEYQSNRAAEKLKSMVKTTAAVIRRETGKREMLMSHIVPGDVVHLAAGYMISADCRIVKSIDLFISESMLTDESIPVEKMPLDIPDADTRRPVELNNLCFMGTNVVSGAATAIVIATGSNTYFGSIGKSIIGESPETSFDIGIHKVSVLLIGFMLVMVPVIFLTNGLVKGDWLEARLFSIALAVGLTPKCYP